MLICWIVIYPVVALSIFSTTGAVIHLVYHRFETVDNSTEDLSEMCKQ